MTSSKNDLFFQFAAVAAAIILGGTFMLSSIHEEELIRLFSHAVEMAGIDPKAITAVINRLPDVSIVRLAVVYMLIKTVLYARMGFAVLYGVLAASLDVRIRLNTSVQINVPSASAYHSARKEIIVGLVIVPLIFIAVPIEHQMNSGLDMTRHVFGAVSAIISYHATKKMMLNKPKEL